MGLLPSRGAFAGNTQGAKGSSKKPQKRRQESGLELRKKQLRRPASAHREPENGGSIQEALAGMAEPLPLSAHQEPENGSSI